MTNAVLSLSQWVTYPLTAILLSMIGTRLCITVLPHIGLLDLPRGRHQHAKAVPRGGGIAIVLSFFVSVGLLYLSCRQNPAFAKAFKSFCPFLLPALAIFITGVLDDRFELRSIVKLLVQIGIAVYLYFSGNGIHTLIGTDLPMYIGIPLTICWVVGIVNAFNLIDGLDGIAAGLASISAISMAVWSLTIKANPVSIVILLIFCGSCLGFLRYNFSPAKIFMGDTGSMFIGLFFAYVSMTESTKAITITSLLVPLMAIGIPIFDVFLAIWRRFFRRYIKHDQSVSIMEGDHDHLHHRIMKEQGTQRKTAYIIYSLAVLLTVCSLVMVFLEEHLPSLIFVVVLIAIFCIIRYAHIEIFDTITSIASGFSVPHRNFILTAIHPVIDTTLVLLAFVITLIVRPAVLQDSFSLLHILIFVAPFTCCLCISGIYQTFWLRAGIAQYYKLFHLCVLAGLIGFTVITLGVYKFNFIHVDLYTLSGFYLLFFLLACMFISGERFLLRYLESFGYRKMLIRNRASDKAVSKTIIYGGGLFCRLYLTNIYCGTLNEKIIDVCGIIDDDFALHHLTVYGFKVLGGIADLERIYARTPFDKIVIALKVFPEERKQIVLDFAAKHNVAVQIFSCAEQELFTPAAKAEQDKK